MIVPTRQQVIDAFASALDAQVENVLNDRQPQQSEASQDRLADLATLKLQYLAQFST